MFFESRGTRYHFFFTYGVSLDTWFIKSSLRGLSSPFCRKKRNFALGLANPRIIILAFYEQKGVPQKIRPEFMGNF